MVRLALLAAAAVVVSSAALAAPVCDTRDKLLELMSLKYSEVPIAMGIGAGGGLVEVLSREEGLTWSIIITSPKGWSCIVSTGEAWRVLEPRVAGAPAL